MIRLHDLHEALAVRILRAYCTEMIEGMMGKLIPFVVVKVLLKIE